MPLDAPLRAQAAHLLVTPLPPSAGAAAQGQHKSGADLVRHVLARVATAVLEVWARPALPSAGPAVVAALVTVRMGVDGCG